MEMVLQNTHKHKQSLDDSVPPPVPVRGRFIGNVSSARFDKSKTFCLSLLVAAFNTKF